MIHEKNVRDISYKERCPLISGEDEVRRHDEGERDKDQGDIGRETERHKEGKRRERKELSDDVMV